MKNFTYLLFCLLLGYSSFAQTTVAGYDANPPANYQMRSNTGFYSQGVSVPTDTRITHIGVNVNTATNFVVAIYQSGTLIANSDFSGTAVTPGPNQIPLVTPINLTSGVYSIAFQGSDNDYLMGNDGSTSSITGLRNNTFGTAVPAALVGAVLATSVPN
ncbi:MAG: hypothetical protein AAGJ18_20435 [Bacteroidota bacterium]